MFIFKKACLLCSYWCNASCNHCITASGPLRRQKIDFKKTAKYVVELAVNEISAIDFSGGEPFKYYKEILSLNRVASSRKLKVGMVTNAYWANDLSSCIKILKEMKESGLSILGISADIFHEKFVFLDNVVTLARACKEAGMQHLVKIVKAGDYARVADYLRQRVSDVKINFEDLLFFDREDAGIAKDRIKDKEGRCKYLSIVLTPEGRVLSCCSGAIKSKRGSFLELGDLRRTSLSTLIKRARGSYLFRFLNLWGPHSLYRELVRCKIKGLPNINRFDKGCNVCFSLLGTNKYKDSINDLFKSRSMKEKIDCADTLFD